MERPENVDFVLKDIRSNILDMYVYDLENRIDKALDYIELIQYNETYGVKEKDYLEIIDILKGE